LIIVKGDDEAAIVARIEKELRGEDIEIFQSDDTEYSMEQVLAFLGYNAKQTRIYVGRLERNTRRIEEDIRASSRLLEPMAAFFTIMLEEMQANTGDAMNAGTILTRFARHKSIQQRLEAEGKTPD
jgi:hypothetical protein